jgi:hypothetical protein
MTKQFNLAPGLSLPPEAITQAFAILARRGAGKTHTASVMAEEMLSAGFPIVALDPLGVWWGLRSGHSIAILGGEHGDVPLEATGGKVVAEFVVRERVPVILDVSAFGENEMRRFVADFASEFYRTNRSPIHWFVDEADEFAPQQAAGGPLAKCLGAMQNIVRRGRARGIGVTLITQRSAVLNKSVLTQAECLIAHQTTAPHDLRAIDDWIKYHGTPEERDRIMRSLPKLQVGEAWVYSPGWLKLLKQVKVRKRTTYDSSATPKPGEVKAPPKSLAAVDLKRLTSQLADTVERAKADDPAELRKRIAELERELKAAKGASNGDSLERAIAKAVAERNREWERKFADAEKHHTGVINTLQRIRELIDQSDPAIVFVRPPDVDMEAFKTAIDKARPIVVPAAWHAKPSTGGGNRSNGDIPHGLGSPHMRILQAAYWCKDDREVTASKLAFYANYTAGGGAFNNPLSKLRSLGLMEGLQITPAGESLMVGRVDPKPRGAELREWLRPKIGGPENKILDVLMEAYPQRLRSDALAEQAGYSAGGGAFNNPLSRLRSLEAAVGKDKDGGTKASDVFFE